MGLPLASTHAVELLRPSNSLVCIPPADTSVIHLPLWGGVWCSMSINGHRAFETHSVCVCVCGGGANFSILVGTKGKEYLAGSTLWGHFPGPHRKSALFF